jgi:Fe2+ transport system protein B
MVLYSKSSLFNALTNSSVPAENYPFCTIDPSEARVEVPDDRVDWLVKSYQSKKVTPAHVGFSFIRVSHVMLSLFFFFLIVDRSGYCRSCTWCISGCRSW